MIMEYVYATEIPRQIAGGRGINLVKVAEDDIAFKLTILKKSLHLNDNTGFCSIIQASKGVFGSLLAKK